ARGRITPDVLAGEKLFHQVGCASCHTPDWHLHAYNPTAKDYTRRYDGDRRFFELQVAYNEQAGRLEGKLVHLAVPSPLPLSPGGRGVGVRGKRLVPRRGAYTIRGIYTDFKYHDVGEAFYQMQFDGSVIRKWK